MSRAPFEDRVVWITGASRGIGRALAERFARDRARLVLCGRDERALDEVVAAARGLGADAPMVEAFDLRSDDALDAFIDRALERFGAPDCLINNAGFNPRKALLEDVAPDEFDAVIAVNLRAPFLILRRVFPRMRERGSGHIVHILSTVCHAAMETMGAYTAAKAGLAALTAVLRKEARPHGVRVTSVYPGGTNTEFRAAARDDYMSPASVAELIHRALSAPDDIAVHELTFRPMVETNY